MIWFDTTGKVTREAPFGKEFSLSITQQDGRITAGKPGIFYVATHSEVNEFGSGGDLIRTFPITAPDKDAQISRVQSVEGQLALEFFYPAKNPTKGQTVTPATPTTPYLGPFDQSWLIVNTVTAEMEAYYDTPAGFTGQSLCYLGRRSFVYYTVKDGDPFIVDADQ
jgi:hypothetical protein